MLKDHKEDFKSKPKYALINRGKSKMGILSKEHNDSMDKISKEKTSGKQ